MRSRTAGQGPEDSTDTQTADKTHMPKRNVSQYIKKKKEGMIYPCAVLSDLDGSLFTTAREKEEKKKPSREKLLPWRFLSAGLVKPPRLCPAYAERVFTSVT